MAISRIDGATRVYELDVATGPVTSFDIPAPTSGGPLIAGDFIVAQFTWDTATDVPISRTLPPDWTSFAGVVVSAVSATTNIQMDWMYHLVTAAEANAQPSSWTLTTDVALDAGIAVERYRGVDQVHPVDVATPAAGYATQITTTTTNTKTSPSVTTTTDGAMVLVSSAVRSGSQSLTSLTPASYTLGASTYTLGARAAAWGYQLQATAGATPAATWTASSSANGAGFTTALRPSAGGPPPVASLVHRVVGIPSGTTVPISCRTGNTASVRVKVGTDPAVTTGVIFSPPVTPNAQGDAQLTVTGLTPGTRYYYRIEMTPSGGGAAALDTAGTVGTFKTAPTGPTNFAFDFSSCCNANDSEAMAAIAARGDDLFLHLGDLYYFDGTGTGQANIRTRMTDRIQAPNHAAVFATTATEYTPSDHDGMTNDANAGSDPTAWANWNAVYRELWPTLDLPGSGTVVTDVVTVDSVSGGTVAGTANNTITWSHTVGTGATLLVAQVIYNDSGRSVTAATFAGSAMTFLGSARSGTAGSDRHIEFWYMVNPPAGAGTVSFTISGTAPLPAGESVSYFNASTSAPFGAFVSDTATAAAAVVPRTITATSAEGELVHTGIAARGSAPVAPPGATNTRTDLAGPATPFVAAGSAEMAGAASVDITWTADANSWAVAAVPIHAEGSAPTPNMGVYRTFTWGRVRFIRLDLRSFATVPTAIDNASKTQLGATQKQWLKDTITAATEPVIVIVQENPWVGPATANEDNWMGYTTERTELANFFAASGKPIVMLGGDAHILAADNGTNAAGGITYFQAAPLHQTSSVKGGPYSAGTYPTTNGVAVESYGRVVVTDDGSTISLAYTGYSADNTARISLTKSVSTVPIGSGSIAATASASATVGGTQVRASALSASATTSSFVTGLKTTSRALNATAPGTAVVAGLPAHVPSLTATAPASASLVGVQARLAALAATAAGTVVIQSDRVGDLSPSAVASAAVVALRTTAAVLSATAAGTASITGVRGRTGSMASTAAASASVAGLRTRLGVLTSTGAAQAVIAAVVAQEVASLVATAQATVSTFGGKLRIDHRIIDAILFASEMEAVLMVQSHPLEATLAPQ